MLRSRTVREGTVGLLILLGGGLLAALVLWLQGISLGQRNYRVIVEFESVAGMEVGGAVRYRGVAVGRIADIQPGPNGVEVAIEISPSDLIIPRQGIEVYANQSGLLSETSIDIVPPEQSLMTKNPRPRPIDPKAVKAKPRDSNCNPELILCNKSRVRGAIGVSVDELLRNTIAFTRLYADPRFFENVNSVVKNSSDAAAEVAKLTREVSVLVRDSRRQVRTLTGSASIAAQQVGLTFREVNSLLVSNRSTLVSTLNNIDQTSAELRSTMQGLRNVVNRAEQGEVLRNLELLSANAAQTSAELRDLSKSLNDPQNLVQLQKTLDSARATFENAAKITSDLDELTGDPEFRNKFRNLVEGLSRLVSSTQQLEQQTQYARVLEPIAADFQRQDPAKPQENQPTPAPPEDSAQQESETK